MGAGAVGAPAWLGACERRPKPAADPDPPYVVKHFDAGQQRTLTALFDTLIPPDDPPGSPGGAEAGLLEFLDRLVAEDAFRKFVPFVRRGVAALDRAASGAHGVAFAGATAAQRTEVLERFQAGAVGAAGAKFFDVMSTFALEGFYGSPFHGGNEGKIAWQWAGITMACPERPEEPPPVGGGA